MNKTIVIYHRADFDGIFCREIARKFLPQAELIGWDYGDPPPFVFPDDRIYMLDISIEGMMDHPNLCWIDHHKSAIDKYSCYVIQGYRIDGVAACRLAWQWFTHVIANEVMSDSAYLPRKEEFIDRSVEEPLAVRLAGEYDIWDKRDPRAELFQHGLRSCDITENLWSLLLVPTKSSEGRVDVGAVAVAALLEAGQAIQYAQTRQNESVIKSNGFTVQFEGLCFLACNAARYNSHLFTAGIKPEHDALMGFNYDGQQWRVSLYGVPGKPDVDLSIIAVKHGGGGHKQACGFRTPKLEILNPAALE
jgi:hypothetical protein